jgi:hypothetical protein
LVIRWPENSKPQAGWIRRASRATTLTGARIRYRLIGLWPINKQNGPTTEFEKTGLEEVRKHPERAYTGYITGGSERFFQAVYADRAVSQACIGCHNAHPSSPKRDFKLDDVMGGIAITIPLGR